MKSKTVFICKQCGNETPRWQGQCPACGAWNSIIEFEDKKTPAAKAAGRSGFSRSAPKKLKEVTGEQEIRFSTGMHELDRVLGGGGVRGSLILVGGAPGIGKSTLLLQICAYLGKTLRILYVSGEESEKQIKLRADRLQVASDELYILSETDLTEILSAVDEVQPDILIADSIQTLYTPENTSAPGSISQVKDCTMALMQLAKGSGVTVFVVGHVNKEGAIARPKVLEQGKIGLNDIELVAKLRKAAAIMQMKLEGQIIARHPEYDMDERMMLDKINFSDGTVTIGRKVYPLRDADFPTINPDSPYELTVEEQELMHSLKDSFLRSDKRQSHVRFLLDKGAFYRCCNQNLMFHGCVPLAKDGSFERFEFDGQRLWGRKLFDFCERKVRAGYFAPRGSREKREGEDFMWWLWCGKDSPIFGRTRMTTFERMLVEDKASHEEPKNPYYRHYDDPEIMGRVLEEFGIESGQGHIINGHIPVKSKDGESPIKCNGRVLTIDGGFCKAYQNTTGIAGYTLIYNSYGMRLVSHGPFTGIINAVEQNTDILSTSNIFEVSSRRRLVSDTDIGSQLRSQIRTLTLLLEAYRGGLIPQSGA